MPDGRESSGTWGGCESSSQANFTVGNIQVSSCLILGRRGDKSVAETTPDILHDNDYSSQDPKGGIGYCRRREESKVSVSLINNSEDT